MNIHFKIQAKQTVNLEVLQKYSPLSRLQTLKALYNSFDCDAFLLPYRVRKLSKRARRCTTVGAV